MAPSSTLTPTTIDDSAASPVLSIRGLEKRFVLHAVDGRIVDGLCGVDLDVFPNEHVCLAGTSGAGKSSLLKAVHRTYVADAGTVHYRTAGGQVVDLLKLGDATMADLRAAEIGYVSQFLRAEPRRGVHDVVARAAIRMGVAPDEAKDRAAAVLRRVNIDERLWATYPSLLSGGEKQRVNIAAGMIVAKYSRTRSSCSRRPLSMSRKITPIFSHSSRRLW